MKTLSDLCLLARVEIRAWTGIKTDERATQEVADNHHTKTSIGRFQKNLLASHKTQLGQIGQIAAQARVSARNNSLPWHAEGLRMVPITSYEKFLARLEPIHKDFNEAVEQFLTDYPNLIEAAKAELNGLFNQNDYPSVDELRRTFNFRVCLEPVPSGSQFDGLLQDIRDDASSAEIQLREQFEQTMQKTRSQAREELRARLVERLVQVWNSLSRFSTEEKARFQNRMIEKTVDLCDLVMELNFESDAEIESWAKQAKALLDGKCDEIRGSDTVCQDVIAKLEKLCREAGHVFESTSYGTSGEVILDAPSTHDVMSEIFGSSV